MPPVDYPVSRNRSLTEPLVGAAAVTPHDTNELPFITRTLWVSVAGAVKVTFMDGQDVTYANLTAGRHPMRVTRVWQTGTAATGIVAEY